MCGALFRVRFRGFFPDFIVTSSNAPGSFAPRLIAKQTSAGLHGSLAARSCCRESEWIAKRIQTDKNSRRTTKVHEQCGRDITRDSIRTYFARVLCSESVDFARYSPVWSWCPTERGGERGSGAERNYQALDVDALLITSAPFTISARRKVVQCLLPTLLATISSMPCASSKRARARPTFPRASTFWA